MVDFNKLMRKTRIEPHVSIDGEVVNIEEITDQSVTLEEYKTVRANSPGFEALIPKMNNEALIYRVKHNLSNCRIESPSTYDYSLKTNLVPELLRRIEMLESENKELKEQCEFGNVAINADW